jgi:hypothetical protein
MAKIAPMFFPDHADGERDYFDCPVPGTVEFARMYAEH